MSSYQQLKITDLYKILIDNVKKLVPKFLIKKNMCLIANTFHYEKLYLKIKSRKKKTSCNVVEFNLY